MESKLVHDSYSCQFPRYLNEKEVGKLGFLQGSEKHTLSFIYLNKISNVSPYGAIFKKWKLVPESVNSLPLRR